MYSQHLDRNPANFVPMTPLDFIERTAATFPQRTAIVHGALRQDWATTLRRCRQLASALQRLGVGRGDTVSVMLPNTPPMVEVHFGVPMSGAVLNALNTRLEAESLAFMLDHAQARVLLVDAEFAPVMRQALSRCQVRPLVIDVSDPEYPLTSEPLGDQEYESLVASGDADFVWQLPQDEFDAICLNYTSGTTGNPKGVVYHHRGAYLNAVSNILEWDMPRHPVYLWTLPMFHCNGWCFPWTIAARAGVNVCLRKIDPALVFELIRSEGVSHYCGAPIVHNMLLSAPPALRAGITHKVAGLIAAPLTRLLAVLQDAPRRTEWNDRCIDSRLIEQVTPRVQLSYNRTQAPWPVSDRDAVLRGEINDQYKYIRPNDHFKDILLAISDAGR